MMFFLDEPMTVFCSCLDCGVSFSPNGGGYDWEKIIFYQKFKKNNKKYNKDWEREWRYDDHIDLHENKKKNQIEFKQAIKLN